MVLSIEAKMMADSWRDHPTRQTTLLHPISSMHEKQPLIACGPVNGDTG
jgi:hypothetical protein